MIPYGRHHIDEEDIDAVVDVLRSGYLTQGPYIEKFEKSICELVGVKYAVAVSSGTAALHMAVLAAGLEREHKLITSPVTFASSANSALFVGATPLFADIDSKTANISPGSIKKEFDTNRGVKVIMPVHFAGLACDMDAIKSISDVNEAVVIEDAAHALGAKYPDGKYIGSCEKSLMTVFSFHPVKSIAAGEGGMITTNDESIYRELLRLRSHGINKLDDKYLLPSQASESGVKSIWYYEMQEVGFNYRITDIQCGLAISQLKKLEKFINKRRKLAYRYDEAFKNMELIKPAQTDGKDISSHHLYVVRINFKELGKSRSQFMNELKALGILTQVHYIPLPMHPYYRNLGHEPDKYINAIQYYNECLSIPLFYDLSDEQQEYVIDSISSLLIN